MADLGSLVVKLALWGASEFRQDMQKAEKSVQSFQERVADMAEEARQSFGGQALEAMVRFGAQAVTAFLEAEKVSQQLDRAVTNAGAAMPGYVSHLNEVADAIERATGVDGDYVKSLEQIALQFRVAPALVERTTRAALDWAAATGGSAKSAMQLLTNATEENLKQLQRWGVHVDEEQVRTKGLTAVLEQFEKVYGGAASQMHAASKSIALNTAAWGDFKEAVGQTITEMLHFAGASQATAKWLDALTEALTSKKAEELDQYRQRVDAISAATERYVNLQAKIDEDAALLFSLPADSPMFDSMADSMEQSRKTLLEMEKDIQRLRGIAAPKLSLDIPAVSDRALAAKNAISIFEQGTDTWKEWTEAVKRADEAYKRFSQNADAASAYANAQDARTASLGSAAEERSIRAQMDVEAAELEASALIEKMNAEMAEADAALARATIAADAAGAAESFQQLYQDAADFARAASDGAARAKDALVNRALSSLGNLGGIIQNAAAAAAGGPIAVVASILLDVLTQSETFQRLVATLNGVVKVVADALGQLLEPLLPLAGAVGMVVTALVPLAAVLIEFLVSAVEPLTPILVTVATVLQGLMPVLTLLMQAFLMITNPLMVIAGPVLKALFDVLKAVALIILYVAKAIGDAWNWIIGAIQSVFRALGDISVFGAKPLGFLSDWADGLESAKADTAAMATQIQNLTGLSYELALAKAKEAQASYENANATKRATQELQNVPDRWKRLLRTGEAADPQAPPTPGSMPPGSAPPAAPVTGGGGSGGLPPVLGSGPISGVYDSAQEVLSRGGTPRPGMGGALGTVWNIFNNLTVNGADSEKVLAEAEQRGYLTGQRAADSSQGTPLRIGPFAVTMG